MRLWLDATRWRQTRSIFYLVSSWKQVMSMIHQVLAYGHFALGGLEFHTVKNNTIIDSAIKR